MITQQKNQCIYKWWIFYNFKINDKISTKEIYWENEPMNYAIKKKTFLKHCCRKASDILKDKNDFNKKVKKKFHG